MKLILFYRHVTVLDYAYLDKQLGPMGNSMQVNVSFYGKTDDEGVVFDFSHAKKKVKSIIDEVCDHRLVVPATVVSCEREADKQIEINYSFGKGQRIEYSAPNEAYFFLSKESYSHQNLKEDLEKIILKQMPENIERVELEFEEESFSGDKGHFHYTHGLKQHYGNCQRLLHGHRNTIDFFVEEQENFELEKRLVETFPDRNIHFAFVENVKNLREVKERFSGQEVMGVAPGESFVVEIEYRSQQGLFNLKIPSGIVHFVPIETTVENLSAHFANFAKRVLNAPEALTVRAYEGIGKGAIFS